MVSWQLAGGAKGWRNLFDADHHFVWTARRPAAVRTSTEAGGGTFTIDSGSTPLWRRQQSGAIARGVINLAMRRAAIVAEDP